MTDFDVIVVGAGIMGLATACGLSDISLKVAIIDDKEITTDLPEHPLVRASAINMSSQCYFSELGIWDPLLNSNRVLTFQKISVREKAGFASLDALSKDYHFANLGHIIENDLITSQLYQKAVGDSNTVFFSSRIDSFSSQTNKVVVSLDDGRQLTARLIVAADGADSSLRRKAGIKWWQYNYRHHALMATIRSEYDHYACARQLFYPGGIIAFLPLWRGNLNCLVWSAKPKEAAALHGSAPDLFSAHLTDMTSRWLGECELISERSYFPLAARYVPSFVQHRLIFIGDASHTIHPLAGQGANLGLRDSFQLVNTIKRLHLAGLDIGLKQNWQRYKSSRNRDVLTMLVGMQAIETLFDGQFILKKVFRGIGMNMIDRMPLVKRRLLEYALGF